MASAAINNGINIIGVYQQLAAIGGGGINGGSLFNQPVAAAGQPIKRRNLGQWRHLGVAYRRHRKSGVSSAVRRHPAAAAAQIGVAARRRLATRRIVAAGCGGPVARRIASIGISI